MDIYYKADVWLIRWTSTPLTRKHTTLTATESAWTEEALLKTGQERTNGQKLAAGFKPSEEFKLPLSSKPPKTQTPTC